ncbi:MAG: DUF998 domain-containing protein [Leptolyngbyaceae cyanobacterium]
MKSKLSRICGLIGLVGCICVVVTDLVGAAVVDKHNPISETISELAIGKYSWIQDMGLNFFAAGLIACAVALYTWKLGGFRWKFGTVLLGLLGIDVFFISRYNQYANQASVGSTIHLYLVCALGITFTLLTFLVAPGLRKVGLKWYRFTLWIMVLWTISAPLFFLVPTSWDGAYERLVALIMVTWVAGISWLLAGRGQKKSFAMRES